MEIGIRANVASVRIITCSITFGNLYGGDTNENKKVKYDGSDMFLIEENVLNKICLRKILESVLYKGVDFIKSIILYY